MAEKITDRYDYFVQELQGCCAFDTECAHMAADDILCDLIEELSVDRYGSIPRVIKRALEAYWEIPKWYA